MENNIEYIIRPRKKLSLGLDELWRYRELFYFFTWRDIKVKYKQTLLGFLWAVLQPLVMMAVFVIFFSRVLQVPTDDVPAPIFYFSGLLLWNMFSSGLSGAANSMVINADIIKKVYFPRLVIPLSAVLVALFDFLMAAIIFIGIIAYYLIFESNVHISVEVLLYFPLALFITLIFCGGLGMFLSALNVKYRDFRYVIPFFIQLLMFLSPVIYPVSLLNQNASLKYILALNPLTGALNLARAGFTSAPLDWLLISISIIAAIIIFIIGIFTFRSTEDYFADLA